MNLTEKVAYIKGLAKGMNLDDGSNKGKILTAMIDLLDDIAVTVSDLDDDYIDLSEQVDEIDDDLHALEEEYYCDEDDCDDDCFYEVTCPTCNQSICLSEDVLLAGQIDCPNCGEQLEFDFDDLCEFNDEYDYGDGCNCGDGCDCGDECDCKE